MIEKYKMENYYYIKYSHQEQKASRIDTIRLYTHRSCPQCLTLNYSKKCPACEKSNLNLETVALGIYFGSTKFKHPLTGKIKPLYDDFSEAIKNLKPYRPDEHPRKPLPEREKELIGKRFAVLLKWFLIEEKKIDIHNYSSMIPVPSEESKNQIDYFGIHLSDSINMNYENLLQRSGDDFSYIGSNLNGQNIMLLDDILTGETETLQRNALKLAQNGAGKILGVVLGRTLDPDPHFYRMQSGTIIERYPEY